MKSKAFSTITRISILWKIRHTFFLPVISRRVPTITLGCACWLAQVFMELILFPPAHRILRKKSANSGRESRNTATLPDCIMTLAQEKMGAPGTGGTAMPSVGLQSLTWRCQWGHILMTLACWKPSFPLPRGESQSRRTLGTHYAGATVSWMTDCARRRWRTLLMQHSGPHLA